MLQNPREADAMTKVQAELDETKIVLVSAPHKFVFTTGNLLKGVLQLWGHFSIGSKEIARVYLWSIVVQPLGRKWGSDLQIHGNLECFAFM